MLPLGTCRCRSCLSQLHLSPRAPEPHALSPGLQVVAVFSSSMRPLLVMLQMPPRPTAVRYPKAAPPSLDQRHVPAKGPIRSMIVRATRVFSSSMRPLRWATVLLMTMPSLGCCKCPPLDALGFSSPAGLAAADDVETSFDLDANVDGDSAQNEMPVDQPIADQPPVAETQEVVELVKQAPDETKAEPEAKASSEIVLDTIARPHVPIWARPTASSNAKRVSKRSGSNAIPRPPASATARRGASASSNRAARGQKAG